MVEIFKYYNVIVVGDYEVVVVLVKGVRCFGWIVVFFVGYCVYCVKEIG